LALPFRARAAWPSRSTPETDFVAKNEQFQDFVRKTTEAALGLSADDVEALKAAAYPDGGTVVEKLTNNVATIGENQQVRRMKTVAVSLGLVVPYMHNAAAPNLGKIGVLVALESGSRCRRARAAGQADRDAHRRRPSRRRSSAEGLDPETDRPRTQDRG